MDFHEQLESKCNFQQPSSSESPLQQKYGFLTYSQFMECRVFCEILFQWINFIKIHSADESYKIEDS